MKSAAGPWGKRAGTMEKHEAWDTYVAWGVLRRFGPELPTARDSRTGQLWRN